MKKLLISQFLIFVSSSLMHGMEEELSRQRSNAFDNSEFLTVPAVKDYLKQPAKAVHREIILASDFPKKIVIGPELGKFLNGPYGSNFKKILCPNEGTKKLEFLTLKQTKWAFAKARIDKDGLSAKSYPSYEAFKKDFDACEKIVTLLAKQIAHFDYDILGTIDSALPMSRASKKIVTRFPVLVVRPQEVKSSQ